MATLKQLIERTESIVNNSSARMQGAPVKRLPDVIKAINQAISDIASSISPKILLPALKIETIVHIPTYALFFINKKPIGTLNPTKNFWIGTTAQSSDYYVHDTVVIFSDNNEGDGGYFEIKKPASMDLQPGTSLYLANDPSGTKFAKTAFPMPYHVWNMTASNQGEDPWEQGPDYFSFNNNPYIPTEPNTSQVSSLYKIYGARLTERFGRELFYVRDLYDDRDILIVDKFSQLKNYYPKNQNADDAIDVVWLNNNMIFALPQPQTDKIVRIMYYRIPRTFTIDNLDRELTDIPPQFHYDLVCRLAAAYMLDDQGYFQGAELQRTYAADRMQKLYQTINMTYPFRGVRRCRDGGTPAPGYI